MRRLPPLNSLRAFEAAGRLLSFTRAADELSVTPAAVSQQVKILEDYFEKPLFRRLTRALQLTPPGEQLLPFVSDALDQLDAGVRLTLKQSSRSILTVSVPRSFGSKWLVPRLESFRIAHPSIDVRLDASDRLANFEDDGVDLAIRYGTGNYHGLVVEKLLDNFTIPVCSPILLTGDHALRSPHDLTHHTLLHVEWRSSSDAAPHWPTWLQAAGVAYKDPESGPRFSNEAMAVQAAVEGMGVLLSAGALSEHDLEKGNLVQPFNDMKVANDITYHLVYPKGNSVKPSVQAFASWLKTTLRC